jgi:hypothetical protein
VITDRAVRNWFAEFRSGDMTLKDKPREVGQPSNFDSNIFKSLLEQIHAKEQQRSLICHNILFAAT